MPHPLLSLRITVLNAKVLADLRAYATAMHRHLGTVIRQQMRLLMLDVIKGTPPFASRAFRHESFGEQRKIGQHAVARDISRVFTSIESIAAKNIKLGGPIRAALQSNNLTVLGHQNSLPELLVKAKVMQSPDASQILDEPTKEIHNRFRIRGKVRGRLPFKFFVKRTRYLRAFIKEEQDDVGILKGGWGAGATTFKVHVPLWISRHFSGEAQDESDRKDDPYAMARNTVPYISAQDADLKIVANALEDRGKAMENQIRGYADRLKKI
jgi:hypothetical protein